jgi:hypothetical protein
MSLPLNLICMFLIAWLQRSVCVFTTILCIPSHQFWVALMFVCFHDKPTHCFVILAEVGVKTFLIELPYGKHVLLNATLDHKDLILLGNFRHAHVHYAA